MDKRVIGFALLAVFIGAAVLFAEVWTIGLFATQSGPTMPRDITHSELELRGLWHGLLWFWTLPSALGALIIAFFKPRRWALYSVCAVLPMFAEMVTGLGLTSGRYDLIPALANIVLMPSFLALYYMLIRRHATA